MINKEEGNGAVRKKEARYPTFGWEGFRETNKCWLKRSHESFISWFLTATSPNSFTINFQSSIEQPFHHGIRPLVEKVVEVDGQPSVGRMFGSVAAVIRVSDLTKITNLYLHTSSRVNL